MFKEKSNHIKNSSGLRKHQFLPFPKGISHTMDRIAIHKIPPFSEDQPSPNGKMDGGPSVDGCEIFHFHFYLREHILIFR